MSKRGLCKFFVNGGCGKGEHCRFSHDLDAPPPKNICKFDQKGTCKYGGRCKYQHVEVSSSHASNPSSSEKKWLPIEGRCGIAIANPIEHFSGFAVAGPVEHQTGIAVGGPVKHRTRIAIASPSTARAKSAENSNSGITEIPPTGRSLGKASGHHEVRKTTGRSLGKASGHHEVRKTSDNVDYKVGADPDLSSLCPFLTAGDCPGGKRCRQFHLDLCTTCGKHCLHPFKPEEREEHMATCQKMQNQLEATRVGEDIECNICLERILSKSTLAERKFGMLPECDHPFCISCIKNWRETSASSGLDVNFNACPTCRKVSYFIVPSNTWYSSEEEKHRIISTYKEKMGSVECNEFEFGNGACPLGNSCFYKHTVRPGSSLWNARLGLGSSRYPDMYEEDDDDDDDGMAAFAFQSMLREVSAFPDLYGPDICDIAGRIDNPDLCAIQALVHHLYLPHASTPVTGEHDEESNEDSDEDEAILNECVQEYIMKEYGYGFRGFY